MAKYTQTCLACGQTFERERGRGPKALTCSGACSTWRARWGDRPRPTGRCAVCNGDMSHRVPHAKTCSADCARIHQGRPRRARTFTEPKPPRMPGAWCCGETGCSARRYSNFDTYCLRHLDEHGLLPRAAFCDECGDPFARITGSAVPTCRACQLRPGRDFVRDERAWALQAQSLARRRMLEAAAPGPSMSYLRRTLLARWIREGRPCWACSVAADTIDHLVPLSRGGTNLEGNLAPACKSCNSSRGARLIVEWRHRASGVSAAA